MRVGKFLIIGLATAVAMWATIFFRIMDIEPFKENPINKFVATEDEIPDSYLEEDEAEELMEDKVPGSSLVDIELENDKALGIYKGKLEKGKMLYEVSLDAETGELIEIDAEYTASETKDKSDNKDAKESIDDNKKTASSTKDNADSVKLISSNNNYTYNNTTKKTSSNTTKKQTSSKSSNKTKKKTTSNSNKSNPIKSSQASKNESDFSNSSNIYSDDDDYEYEDEYEYDDDDYDDDYEYDDYDD